MKIVKWQVAVMAAALMTVHVHAQEATPPASAPAAQPPPTTQPTAEEQAQQTRDKISYVLGLNYGTGLKNQGININVNAISAGIADAYSGELRMSQEEIREVLGTLQQILQARAAQLHELAEANLVKADEFLAKNKDAPGVVTLPSGLQYKVLKEGDGPTPGPNDLVTVHYTGTLVDGTRFDSSVERGEPAQIPVTGVIRGWSEALQKMKVGSKWQLFIPPDLGYGDSPRPGGPIPPNAALVFEVELLGVTPGGAPAGMQ